MQLKSRTILITGGTSGIGLELARQLLSMGNTVIITGRDQSKLDQASKQLAGVHTVRSDVSKVEDVKALHKEVLGRFPALDVLINNAGIMRKISVHDEKLDLEELTSEIDTNLSGLIWMTKQFLPDLKARPQGAIVNVSSGLAFVPFAISPVYSATKAGVHAFTECLRIQLKNTRVMVIELAPPGTETPLFTGGFDKEDIGDVKAMDVKKMVSIFIRKFEGDTLEIRPGLANVLKIMSRVAPHFIMKQLAKPVDRMLLNVDKPLN